ncbi:hypothetical protein GY644_24945, partial [Escherichia coli]|uniref:helix-turn-helix domain-containing protein n=1 Tax=Escherichia coli TaxID=562 RepID=UPI0015C02227
KRDPKLSQRKAAKLYGVAQQTLSSRISGRPARRDIRANSLKLTESEDEAVLSYILDLDAKGFSPTIKDVEDMANLLLAERCAGRVGKHWASK